MDSICLVNIIIDKLLLVNLDHWQVEKLISRQEELRRLIAEKKADYRIIVSSDELHRLRRIKDKVNRWKNIFDITEELSWDIFRLDPVTMQTISNALDSFDAYHYLNPGSVLIQTARDNRMDISTQDYNRRYWELLNALFMHTARIWQYPCVAYAQWLHYLLVSLSQTMLALVRKQQDNWAGRKGIAGYQLKAVSKLTMLMDLLLDFGCDSFGSLPRVLQLQEVSMQRKMSYRALDRRLSLEGASIRLDENCKHWSAMIQSTFLRISPDVLFMQLKDLIAPMRTWLQSITELVASRQSFQPNRHVTFAQLYGSLVEAWPNFHINSDVHAIKYNIDQIIDGPKYIDAFSMGEMMIYDCFLMSMNRDYADPYNFSRLMCENVRAGRWILEHGFDPEYRKPSLILTEQGWLLQRTLDRHSEDDSFCKWSMWLHRESLSLFRFYANLAIEVLNKGGVEELLVRKLGYAVTIRQELVNAIIRESLADEVFADRTINCNRIVETFYVQPIRQCYHNQMLGVGVEKQSIKSRCLAIIERFQSRGVWTNPFRLWFNTSLGIMTTVESEERCMALSILCDALTQWIETRHKLELNGEFIVWLHVFETKFEELKNASPDLIHAKAMSLDIHMISLYLMVQISYKAEYISQTYQDLFEEVSRCVATWLASFPTNHVQQLFRKDTKPQSSVSLLTKAVLYWCMRYCELAQMQLEEHAAMQRFINQQNLRAIDLPDLLTDIENTDIAPLKTMIETRLERSHVGRFCEILIEESDSDIQRVHAIDITHENFHWIDAMLVSEELVNEVTNRMQILAVKYRDVWVRLVDEAIYREPTTNVVIEEA